MGLYAAVNGFAEAYGDKEEITDTIKAGRRMNDLV
jgi:hypothetical protein